MAVVSTYIGEHQLFENVVMPHTEPPRHPTNHVTPFALDPARSVGDYTSLLMELCTVGDDFCALLTQYCGPFDASERASPLLHGLKALITVPTACHEMVSSDDDLSAALSLCGQFYTGGAQKHIRSIRGLIGTSEWATNEQKQALYKLTDRLDDISRRIENDARKLSGNDAASKSAKNPLRTL